MSKPMKVETDPISEDEWLLRRVRLDQLPTEEEPRVSPNAFEPRTKGREPDTNGISLYRESCLASPYDILAAVAEAKLPSTGIVRVPVSLLTSLNLAVVIDIDPRVRGHVVVPKLNAVDYMADKPAFTPIKRRLANVASEPGNFLYPLVGG